MTDQSRLWGAGPSPRYDAIAARFRPALARIREGAVKRDVERILPHEEITWLREVEFQKLRLPTALGGADATLAELFGLIIELGEADPNVANAIRSHLGFTEDVLNTTDSAFQSKWLGKLGAGETIGSGFSEAGDAKLGSYSTRLTRDGDGYRLNGEKFYTTGSLYADWVNLGAADDNGDPIGALISTRAAGVEILDDWDGFGQSLTASGTIRFTNVSVPAEWLKPSSVRFGYVGGFFQLIHLATLAGIARAASTDLSRLVAERKRVYGRSNASRSSADPQVLQVVGRVRSLAYSAGAIVLKAAEALDRAYLARAAAPDVRDAAQLAAEVEVSQSVTVVSSLVLEATTILFDALGASAAKKSAGLDRHWRNARTISSHNPRIYHDRIVGDYAVNGTVPPPLAGVGVALPEKENQKT